MSSPEINYKIGNESLIEVLPNASERLLGLLEKQGKADFGALRVAVVGGGCSGRFFWFRCLVLPQSDNKRHSF